jgi:HEAT repeat protein
MTRRRPLLWIALVLTAMVVTAGRADLVRAQDSLTAAIDSLGAFEFPTRMTASRTIRRAAAAEAVPALTAAVKNHKDSYVRYRALVLLAGFDDKATSDVMVSVISDRNDRLRAVAYEWFESHAASAPIAAMVEALPKESSEFVRPALTRALAALHADPRARAAVTPLIVSGEDFFRGEVIQALGDYKATWAVPAILAVAKLDGPLQDDAVLALGKLGDTSVLPALAELQKQAPRERQPAVAAASCMLAVNCDGYHKYLDDTLRFAAANPGFQILQRTSAHALGAFARRGDQAAFKSLIDVALSAGEQARAPIALSLGAAAVERPAAMMTALASRSSDQAAAIELLRDAFDMLEEDFAEEMFYVAVRKSYWAAPEGSPARRLAEAVLQKLEF